MATRSGARIGATIGTLGLVACSSFGAGPATGADAGAEADARAESDAGCPHTLCEEFDGPLSPSWKLSNEIGSAVVADGVLTATTPSGFGAGGMTLAVAVDPPASHIKCQVSVRVDQKPNDGTVWLLTLRTENPLVFVDTSLAKDEARVLVGVDQTPPTIEARTASFPLSNWTTIALEAGDGIAPVYTQDDMTGHPTVLNLSKPLQGGKITQVAFELKRGDAASMGQWVAVFDHAWCDALP